MRESLSNGFSWTPTKTKRYGVAIFNFKSINKHSLELEIGECVHIKEECVGWYRGFSARNRSRRGIFPTTYVALKPFKMDSESGLFESVTPLEDPTSLEVVTCLREWHRIWRNGLFLKRSPTDQDMFNTIMVTINELIDYRKQLINGTITQDQIKEIKFNITKKIDWGNRLLKLDLIPRKDGIIADAEHLSPIELFAIHLNSSNTEVQVSSSSTNGARNSTTGPTAVSYHFLYLHIRDVVLSISNSDDTFELDFTIIDLSSHLSEKFVARINGTQQLNLSTVFTHLSMADVTRDLHLLLQVFRVGRILVAEGKSGKTCTLNSPKDQIVKRPYGSAVIALADVIKCDGQEREVPVKLSNCSNENDFHQLHDFLVRKQSNKSTHLQNSTLTLTLKLLTGSNLNKVSSENPLIFKNVTCLTGKRGFPEIIMPGDVRNDLYIVVESGEFEKGGKSIPKNIEATLSLVGFDGRPIYKSIAPGTGVEPVTSYSGLVLYHNNNPRWLEHLKILIPFEVFDLLAHVRLEFRHCSAKDSNSSKEKKLLGFSFIPLSDENGTIINDGGHEVYVYRASDSAEARTKSMDPSFYLRLPYGSRDTRNGTSNSSLFSRSAKEIVHVRTLLCSTKLTQNGNLLALLKWRQNPHSVEHALLNVLKLNGEEIVKFLQDILDALFSTFSTSDGNSTNYTDVVFRVLVHIFSLLDDPKYEHFKPVLDTYICGHFAAALVYKGLLYCAKQCANSIEDLNKQDAIQRSFKSLQWIFKFLVQSRILYATQATLGGNSNEELFKEDLFSLFSSFNRMLTYAHEQAFVRSQVTLMDNISLTYEQLLRVICPQELARHIKGLINSLSISYQELAVPLLRAKLNCIKETIGCDLLFKDAEARRELMDTFCRHLKEHVNRKQELQLCSQLISDMLIFIHNEKLMSTLNVTRDVDILVIGLFDAIVRVIIELSTTTVSGQPLQSAIPISTSLTHAYLMNLIALLRVMDDVHFAQLMTIKNRREKKDTLFQVFYVFKQLFNESLLPSDWTVMRMMSNHVVLCSLQELSQSLVVDFLVAKCPDAIPQVTFDEQLWSSYFNLSVGFLTQSCLQLETFSDVKKNAILDKYADMRVLMGFQILSMWEQLGEYKKHFIPSMVAPFLEVTLVPEKELRRATLPIFYDMIDAEFKATGTFKQVESRLIDKLDLLVSENKGDDEFRQLFMTILLDKVGNNCPLWKDQGVRLIQSISKLLELLLDYRHVMDGDQNRDKRMSCTVNLLTFYKDEINRKEMYIRYIYKLTDLHLPAENYTEAAFTLKLHADSLNWTWTVLPVDAVNGHPEQLEWQRKEQLYQLVIGYFDCGKCWEEGLPLIKELAHFYETRRFDYVKLSAILKRQATFLDNIMTQLRPEPEYFRVGFFGKAFPSFLRNKLFVYRGLEYEKMAAFTARLQNEFPQSQVMTKNSPPDEATLSSQQQFIQICNVRPIADTRAEFEGQDVPEKVTAYYLVNDVRTFVFDRPIHKGPIDKDNEFKSLWVERTTLVTGAKLPGILRWFEVETKRVSELSPLEHACESVDNMNRELQKQVMAYTADPSKAISPLSMRLQGVIEAAVNGGVTKYQEAFFNAKYIHLHPEHAHHIKRLKTLILQKVRILEGGLSLHGRLVPPNIQPLHRRLVERFTLMRHNVMEASAYVADCGHSFDPLLYPSKRPSIINTPLPPIPIAMDRSAGQSNLPMIEQLVRNGSNCSPNGQMHEDEIYSVPHDCFLNQPPILPDRNSPLPVCRPRSAGYSSLDGNCSPALTPPPRPNANAPQNGSNSAISAIMLQRSRSIPRNNINVGCNNGHGAYLVHQNSSPNFTSQSPTIECPTHDVTVPAPPLPPRNTLERNKSMSSFDRSSSSDVSEQRPALPKRTAARKSTPIVGHDGTFLSESNQNGDTQPPPPLPCKRPAPQPPVLPTSPQPSHACPIAPVLVDTVSHTVVTESHAETVSLSSLLSNVSNYSAGSVASSASFEANCSSHSRSDEEHGHVRSQVLVTQVTQCDHKDQQQVN